jgi:glutathione S-transferase
MTIGSGRLMKLYDYVLSGNCYKIRLLASLLNLKFETVPVDFYPGREHRSPAFRELNPLGQIPALEDDGIFLRDAQAILVYVANRYDATKQWWPANDPVKVGQVQQWLSFADQITATASAARLHDMLGYELDVGAARSGACRLFRVLDDHLIEQEFEGRSWIVGDAPTIADIACFPYTALAADGGIELTPFKAVQRWLRAVSDLPNFIAMPGIRGIK